MWYPCLKWRWRRVRRVAFWLNDIFFLSLFIFCFFIIISLSFISSIFVYSLPPCCMRISLARSLAQKGDAGRRSRSFSISGIFLFSFSFRFFSPSFSPSYLSLYPVCSSRPKGLSVHMASSELRMVHVAALSPFFLFVAPSCLMQPCRLSAVAVHPQ